MRTSGVFEFMEELDSKDTCLGRQGQVGAQGLRDGGRGGWRSGIARRGRGCATGAGRGAAPRTARLPQRWASQALATQGAPEHEPGVVGRGGAWAAAAGGQAARNLVSTFCYLSLEREAGNLVHGGRQALLGGAAQAAQRHGGHHQDEEHEAHAVAEDACVHAARLARRHQLLLGCKDTDIGAWPSRRRAPTGPRPPGATGAVGAGEGCSARSGRGGRHPTR